MLKIFITIIKVTYHDIHKYTNHHRTNNICTNCDYFALLFDIYKMQIHKIYNYKISNDNDDDEDDYHCCYDKKLKLVDYYLYKNDILSIYKFKDYRHYLEIINIMSDFKYTIYLDFENLQLFKNEKLNFNYIYEQYYGNYRNCIDILGKDNGYKIMIDKDCIYLVANFLNDKIIKKKILKIKTLFNLLDF